MACAASAASRRELMRRIVGYTLFFIGIGMLIAFFMPNEFVTLLLAAGLLILGYLLFCGCRQ